MWPRLLGVQRDRDVVLDLRVLTMAELKRDPSLVEEALRYLERRIPSASPGERLELEEWQGILQTMSVSRLRRFLVQDDARSTRLRQSLPFLNVLSPEERDEIMKSARDAQ